MKTAKIAELKDNLSRFLQHVKRGGEVIVVERDQPIARIVPLAHAVETSSDDERLARLERRGLARRGSGEPPAWLGRRRPARVSRSVLAGLLAERREGW